MALDPISLPLLSFLLLALFAARELRLDCVHSCPGGAFYAPPAAGLSQHQATAPHSEDSGTPSPSPSPKWSGPRGGVGPRGRLFYGIPMLQFAAFIVWAFWVQLNDQICIGYSPVRTVGRLTPMFMTGLICNVFVALVIGRVPALWLLASGTLTTKVRGVANCVQPRAGGRHAP
ncbi:hypothetical protein B0H17DRAFT_332261 [Mycena rosella]|uniref:Uncharacterized protein n=1 Tax=Mycena rosella TaxID=1033263 RepID=A0AAD7DSD3_MYCRO|nr:hypothetical protein B0H17DRAFT_332261 [Mycena rosella]